MKNIEFKNEQILIERFTKSENYISFFNDELPRKRERENIAYGILRNKLKEISKELFSHFIKIVDDNTNYWFGSLFQGHNFKKLMSNSIDQIKKLLNEVLNSEHDHKTIINNCLTNGNLKIDGGGSGLVTLLLYLTNSNNFNIWIPTTEEALKKINRIEKQRLKSSAEKYDVFNKAANKFKNEYNFSPKEMDWILTNIKKYVELSNDMYYVNSEMFKSKKVNLKNGFELYLQTNDININNYDDQYNQTLAEEVVKPSKFFEGATKTISVNYYERNPDARKKCIQYYGSTCIICGFNFSQIYKKVQKEFIHVHHIKPLSKITDEYEVDPINDLRPVCPNCHAVIHLREPAYTIDEVKDMIID